MPEQHLIKRLHLFINRRDHDGKDFACEKFTDFLTKHVAKTECALIDPAHDVPSFMNLGNTEHPLHFEGKYWDQMIGSGLMENSSISSLTLNISSLFVHSLFSWIESGSLPDSEDIADSPEIPCLKTFIHFVHTEDDHRNDDLIWFGQTMSFLKDYYEDFYVWTTHEKIFDLRFLHRLQPYYVKKNIRPIILPPMNEEEGDQDELIERILAPISTDFLHPMKELFFD